MPAPVPALAEPEAVLTLWPAIVDAVCEQNQAVGTCLREARADRVENGRLVIAFHDGAKFAKRKVEDNQALVQGAVKRVTGAPLPVAFELGDAVEVEGPAMLSEEELLERLKSEFGAEEVFDDADDSKESE
ncbi:MAG: hypothetical protein H0V29_03395 [Thermoleophilaceae bacterium]|nr:hypothetical protein [Thermoleophilaceae bacterium]